MPARAAPILAQVALPNPLRTAVILLIEDDLVTSHIVTALLKRLGQSYVVVQTGAEALERLERQPVDLIITDLLLPDTHGLDLVDQLLVKPYLQDIPVMVCTAAADAATVERALAVGCVDVVAKPISADVFAGRVERALKRAPARWENWREVVRRLRVDSRTFRPILELARDHLAELVSLLGRARDGYPAAGESPSPELGARVLRMRGAALNVGAVRTVQLVDFLWSGRATRDDVADLHAALTIELSVFDQALASRSSLFAALAEGR